jgi:two-component system, NtrC family, response regulator AtoC
MHLHPYALKDCGPHLDWNGCRQDICAFMSPEINHVLDSAATAGLVFGQGSTMQTLNAIVADVARTDIAVLLIGESGTGKEVYARLIHRLSGLNEAQLTKVCCATLDPGRLLEQVRDCLRAVVEGHRTGSLFLDGVEELDLACQRVLLSLLPDGERNGKTGKMTARLISSTTGNLEKETEEERFRRELYFRINGVCLRLPALRDRKEDIPALLECFLAKYAGELKKTAPVLSNEMMELLASYGWPGNIRELENVAKKIVAVGDAHIALEDLRAAPLGLPPMDGGPRVTSLKLAARAASRRTERELILKALERTHWNRKRAAQELQISYKALLYKIKQTGARISESGE